MNKDYTMRILGITGRLKSGKDTAFEILKKQLAPLPVVRVGFADALKDDVCKMVGCDRKFIEDHKDNFRLVLQGYGTNIRRQLFGDDYWILRAGKTISQLADKEVPPFLVVVTDVRFKNEAKFLRDIGGKIWRIERFQQGDSRSSLHVSESESDTIEVDETVHNDSSMVAFEHEIQLAYMRSFCTKHK